MRADPLEFVELVKMQTTLGNILLFTAVLVTSVN